MKNLCAGMILRRARPLEPAAFQALVADPSASLPDRTNLIPDLLSGGEVEKFTFPHSASDIADDFPIGFRSVNRINCLTYSLDAPLRIHESAILLKGRGCREKNRAKFFRRFIQEHVLDNHQLQAL